MSEIEEIMRSRIMILDGAMGTMIQKNHLPDNNLDALNLTHPEIISDIHRRYILEGADIIETNTFSANSISQEEYGRADQASQIALEGARIARKAADEYIHRKIFVAGSVGPTTKSLSLAQDISNPAFRPYSFDQMAEAYKQQISALKEGGVDLLMIETCFDALNTKAALYAAEDADIPVIVSVSSSDKSGRTLTGQTIEAFYTSVKHFPLLAFGLNCSLGAADLIPLVREVSHFSKCPLICYPNAGLPNELGLYDETPAQTASAISQMASEGLLNIVGGCCGTTPEHIRAIASAVSGQRPREVPEDSLTLQVSGLESVTVDSKRFNFTNIGERTNVAGSRRFAKLIAAGDYDTALQVASDQIENGASIIDINMDDAMLDSQVEMQRFLRYISNDPSVAKAALMIDSSHWETIVSGLKNAQGKCIVNSISLKEGEEVFLSRAREINKLGAAMVVMAFDEQGQATTYQRKIQICQRAYNLLTAKAGIEPSDIIFDVNILSIGTGIEAHARYAIDFIDAVRWIKAHLPGAYTSGGVSNLSFAFRGNNTVRQAMHSVFLYYAIKAGLDMAIVNPSMLQVYDQIEPSLRRCVEDVIMDKDAQATERLIMKAQEIMAQDSIQDARQAGDVAPTTSITSVEERVQNALIQGRSEDIEKDLMTLCQDYGSAVKVIEGPLMSGMEQVGKFFGDGKMFLPQVVKSAKVMREAVQILQPYMDTASTSMHSRPRIVMATVKGDVHDIGKNITGIVLSCNGFDVTDLGVMVDKERILEEASKQHSDIIAVSGLITPSLYQMEELCREMTRRGLDTPLFIGGATTSALHTAVKLAPEYAHVFYGADASQSAVMAKRCMMDREKFEAQEHEAQEKLRILYNSAKHPSPLRQEGPVFGKETFLKKGEYDFKSMPSREVNVVEVVEYFDWRMYLAIWGVTSRATGGILKDQADDILKDGKAALEKMERDGECVITVSDRFFQAFSDHDFICTDEGKDFPMLRQESPDSGDRCLSLSDFVPDKSLGIKAPMGIFAISVRPSRKHEAAEELCGCEQCRNDYESLTQRAVRLTLAEAASTWLDHKLVSEISRKGIKVAKPAAGYASCPDHTIKKDILDMLPGGERLGITLTESYAMIPDASICGFIFVHPQARYPEIRKISQAQCDAYAISRHFTPEQEKQFLGHLIG